MKKFTIRIIVKDKSIPNLAKMLTRKIHHKYQSKESWLKKACIQVEEMFKRIMMKQSKTTKDQLKMHLSLCLNWLDFQTWLNRTVKILKVVCNMEMRILKLKSDTVHSINSLFGCTNRRPKLSHFIRWKLLTGNRALKTIWIYAFLFWMRCKNEMMRPRW